MRQPSPVQLMRAWIIDAEMSSLVVQEEVVQARPILEDTNGVEPRYDISEIAGAGGLDASRSNALQDVPHLTELATYPYRPWRHSNLGLDAGPPEVCDDPPRV